MGYFSSFPQVRVNLFTERGNISVTQQLRDPRQGDDIISVQTQKDLGQAAGSFAITLTARTFGNWRTFTSPATEAEQQFAASLGTIAETSLTVRHQEEGVGWKDLLKPGDLVVIEMGPDKPQPSGTDYAQKYTRGLDGTTEIVMVGSIDDVRFRTAIGGDGKPQRAVTIRGRDFGKYLVDDQIWRDPWWDWQDSVLRFRRGFGPFPKSGLMGTPASIIDHVLRVWIYALFDVEFLLTIQGTVVNPGDFRLSQILRYAMDSGTPQIPFLNPWLDYEGSPWALFQSILGNPWYVLHLDTRRQQDIACLLAYTSTRIDSQAAPRKPQFVWNTDLSRWDHQVALLLYRNPASCRFYDDWLNLPTRSITEDDVVEEDLGISLEEVFTRWRVLPTAPGFDSVKVAVSGEKQQDMELERRFGFRPRILTTPHFQDMKDPLFIRKCEEFTKMVRDWDILNLCLLNGILTVKGMASVRVGDRLHYRKPVGRGIDFYVEGVAQDFRQFEGWRTTLQVTRGQTHRDKGEPLFDDKGQIVFPDFNAMGLV